MALNRYMHPRNVYKTPPDYAKMAVAYPEFMEVAKLEVDGKVKLDYKDPHALRVLTKCLLRRDFDLDVTIPENRLVPTLPLRLNYLLWIEDIMSGCNTNALISGLDIGTGACAVYPLLAAKKNKWKMLATESDSESLQIANQNIIKNNLQDDITVIPSRKDTLISHLFEEDQNLQLDFCLCNPPFYSSIEELYESRSPARPPPKNAFTGSPQELITHGGELKFITKLVEESQLLRDKIRVYTTMAGFKHTLKSLLELLKAEGINNFTHTEFCQGRTTRWGLAWSFRDDIKLSEIVAPPKHDDRKRNTTISFTLPKLPDITYDIQTIAKKILDILESVDLKPISSVKKGGMIRNEYVAYDNTWTNQRRKRRQKKLLADAPNKIAKLGNGDGDNNVRISIGKNENIISSHEPTNEGNDNKGSSRENINCKSIQGTIEIQKATENTQKQIDQPVDKNKIEPINLINNQNSTNAAKEENNSTTNIKPNNEVKEDNMNQGTDMKETINAIPKCSDTNQLQSQTENIQEGIDKPNGVESRDPLLKFQVNISKKNEHITLELVWIAGDAGKEGTHQILQYIQNKWK